LKFEISSNLVGGRLKESQKFERVCQTKNFQPNERPKYTKEKCDSALQIFDSPSGLGGSPIHAKLVHNQRRFVCLICLAIQQQQRPQARQHPGMMILLF